MSGATLPSGCVLDRRVRVDADEGDEDDLIGAEHPFSILSCVDKQALGFNGHEADEAVRSLELGAHLAGAPPGLSCLVLRGGSPDTTITAVDRNVVVFTTTLPSLGRFAYLVYDAVTESFRMIPLLRGSSSRVALTSGILIARPARGRGVGEYALVKTGKLAVAGEDGGRGQERDSLFIWRPSSSSRPWSEAKKASIPDDVDRSVYQADEVFSLDGHGYWADLLCGVMHCSCDAIFDHNSGDDDVVVEFGFIHLPIEPGGHHRNAGKVAQPVAYRTVGVVQGSAIRFVSISGFLEDVELKDRTVTVWRLLGRHGDMGWEKEHELRVETLWGLEGFGDLPKDLTPMYPVISTEEEDVVYFALGEYYENRRKGKFVSTGASYLLGVDMRRQILLGSVLLPCLSGRTVSPDLVSCGFSRYIRTVDLDPYLRALYPFAFGDEETP